MIGFMDNLKTREKISEISWPLVVSVRKAVTKASWVTEDRYFKLNIAMDWKSLKNAKSRKILNPKVLFHYQVFMYDRKKIRPMRKRALGKRK